MHSTSKKHSPIVVPSVAAPGLLVLRERIKSEMESARVVVGWGKDEIKCMSVFREKINFILPSEKKIIAPLVLKPRKQKLFSLLIFLSKRKLRPYYYLKFPLSKK